MFLLLALIAAFVFFKLRAVRGRRIPVRKKISRTLIPVMDKYLHFLGYTPPGIPDHIKRDLRILLESDRELLQILARLQAGFEGARQHYLEQLIWSVLSFFASYISVFQYLNTQELTRLMSKRRTIEDLASQRVFLLTVCSQNLGKAETDRLLQVIDSYMFALQNKLSHKKVFFDPTQVGLFVPYREDSIDANIHF